MCVPLLHVPAAPLVPGVEAVSAVAVRFMSIAPDKEHLLFNLFITGKKVEYGLTQKLRNGMWATKNRAFFLSIETDYLCYYYFLKC